MIKDTRGELDVTKMFIDKVQNDFAKEYKPTDSHDKEAAVKDEDSNDR